MIVNRLFFLIIAHYKFTIHTAPYVLRLASKHQNEALLFIGKDEDKHQHQHQEQNVAFVFKSWFILWVSEPEIPLIVRRRSFLGFFPRRFRSPLRIAVFFLR